MHAFITSKLDYCNSLYFGFEWSSLHGLQLVQNAAAQLSTGSRRQDQISPVLGDLHWLPVRSHIDLKILLLTSKILNGLASRCELVLLYFTPHRKLRSSSQMILMQPRAKLKSRGDQAFAVVVTKHWNNLPLVIHTAESAQSFKSCLQSVLHLISIQFKFELHQECYCVFFICF